MANSNSLINSIFSIQSELDFDLHAMEVFQFQYQTNDVYRKYCDLLSAQPKKIKQINDIPFLPIQFFKSEEIKSGEFNEEIRFLSSGTGGNRSKHLLKSKALYERSFLEGFKRFYGDPAHYTILALLPSYLEQGDSSLVYMCDRLIKESKSELSGFYMNDHSKLAQTLAQMEQLSQKTLLIGVSFALIDFVEAYPDLGFEELVVMETGGMKGRKKEIIREELHQLLKDGFGVENIHSEYGMTELLSQAYSQNGGLFTSPPWMKVMIRRQEDPFEFMDEGQVGGINIIDLANIYSCSFIQTDDLGKITKDQFEVLGRFDRSEVRGCSQLAI